MCVRVCGCVLCVLCVCALCSVLVCVCVCAQRTLVPARFWLRPLDLHKATMKREARADADKKAEAAAAQQAWRQQAKKTILSNAIPAKTMHEDLAKAQAAGAKGCEDYLSTKGGAHAKRDLTHKLLKENAWPGLYWAEIPVADLKTGKQKNQWVPFLLPHEWLPLYTRWPEAWEDLRCGEEDPLRRRLLPVAKQLKADPDKLVALGLHGDGVPIGGTLNEDSLDVFNLNLITSKNTAACASRSCA